MVGDSFNLIPKSLNFMRVINRQFNVNSCNVHALVIEEIHRHKWSNNHRKEVGMDIPQIFKVIQVYGLNSIEFIILCLKFILHHN